MLRINNKVKQFFGNNWGSNKFIKKHTDIPISFGNEKLRPKSKRKKGKVKKVYVFKGNLCPFCETELEKVKAVYKEPRIYQFLDRRKSKCSKCGSYEVLVCPACKSKTWYNPKTEVYKHKFMSCGFVGKKLKR